MLDNWEVIYSTNQLYIADMVQSILEDNKIESVILNKQDSTYKFGDIEVYVSVEDVLKAKQLMLQFEGE